MINNKWRSRIVRTLRYQSDGAEMSWVRNVLGPNCLDTFSRALVQKRTSREWFLGLGLGLELGLGLGC